MSDRDLKPDNVIEQGDTPNVTDDVLDVAGAMALLRIGRNSLYELCSENKIPHRRFGRKRGSIRFSRAALLRWLEGDR